MTREELIKKQAEIYTDDASNYTEWTDDGGWTDSDDKEFVEKAFIEGAKWADNNPKSPWISVEDDLPYYHEYLLDTDISTKKVLVILQYNEDPTLREVQFCKMFNHKNMGTFNDRWYWNCPRCYKVTHWMSIPEFPN